MDLERCVRRIIVVIQQTSCQVLLVTGDPIRTGQRKSPLAASDNFSNCGVGYVHRNLQFVSMRITNDEAMICPFPGDRFVEIRTANYAKAVLSLEFDWVTSCRRAVGRKYLFFYSHRTFANYSREKSSARTIGREA